VSLCEASLGDFGSSTGPWRNVPLYFSFDSYIGGSKREDATLDDKRPSFSATEFAPRVTIPLHFGDWLGAYRERRPSVPRAMARRSTHSATSTNGPGYA